MNTPIADFLREYEKSPTVRFHMPGHKGRAYLGCEGLDITEIMGADSLYEADGIIAESEANASRLFGSKATFYSTEGSSQCIRAMLYLLIMNCPIGSKPLILAARNVHKSFIYAAALIGFDVEWLLPEVSGSICGCKISPDALEKKLSELEIAPAAVYVTSPDYLGGMADIPALAEVCHRHGTRLAVDNAHGAYLHFLEKPIHPIDLGADICCDSAHKTLPALTGGAYLHIAKTAPRMFSKRAVSSLALFSSSSPSYLILQSLDMVNERLPGFRKQLEKFLPKAERLRKDLLSHGFTLTGGEALKLTLATKSFGYTGAQLAAVLESKNIFPEFYDPDFLVLMLSPLNNDNELEGLSMALLSLEKKPEIKASFPPLPRPKQVFPVREAIFKESAVLPVSQCLGRVCACAAISCPPAVPLVVCGERIDESVLESFAYYGVESCAVIKE